MADTAHQLTDEKLEEMEKRLTDTNRWRQKEDIMASTTYEHFVDTNKMYSIYGRFLNLTKTYHLGNVTVMVRNAGQLPQPFWLGAACGGGSRGAARCAART